MPTFILKHKDGTTQTAVATANVKQTRGDLTVTLNGNAVYELEARDSAGNHTYRWVRDEGKLSGQ